MARSCSRSTSRSAPGTSMGRAAGRLVPVVAVSLALAACTGSDDGSDADAGPGTSAAVDGAATTSPMRPVPTVAPSTIDGQAVGEDLDDGVVEVAPTVAPPSPPAPSGDPTGSTVAPPSTAAVGDPQPAPGATSPPPPATVEPLAAACERLAGVGVPAEIEGWIQPIDAAEAIDDADGCRYTAGRFVTEVWFVPLTEVREDWFLRSGIEPVAVAGGDAVGLDGFRSPSGATGAGYTVATVGGNQGVIVSVADFEGAALAADFVAALAAEAA